MRTNRNCFTITQSNFTKLKVSVKQLNVSEVSDRYYQIGAEFVKKINLKGLIRYPQIVHPFAKL